MSALRQGFYTGRDAEPAFGGTRGEEARVQGTWFLFLVISFTFVLTLFFLLDVAGLQQGLQTKATFAGARVDSRWCKAAQVSHMRDVF